MKKRFITIMLMLILVLSTATVSVLAIDPAGGNVEIKTVSASVDKKSGNKATVKWSVNGKADKFIITANGPTDKTVTVNDGAATSKEITGLTKGGEYTFTVKAVSGDYSSEKKSGTYFIMKPVNDLKLYPAYNSIALEWKSVPGAYDYKVFRKKKGEKKFKLIKQFRDENTDFRAYDNKNMVAYIDKGLKDAKTQPVYTYYVLARTKDKKHQTSPKVSKYRTTSPVHQMFLQVTFKNSATLSTHKATGEKTNTQFKFKAGETVYAHSYLLGQYKFYAKKGGKTYLFYANEDRLRNKKALYRTKDKYNYPAKSAVYFANTSGIDSKTGYMVWTNFYTQHIYVLKGSKGKWRNLGGTNNWEISSGVAATPTPAGKFTVRKKWGWHDNVKQWLVFSGGETSIHGRVDGKGYGKPYSHGCIRNPNERIPIIYNNLAMKSRVFNY